jgi:hypothetical protein
MGRDQHEERLEARSQLISRENHANDFTEFNIRVFSEMVCVRNSRLPG